MVAAFLVSSCDRQPVSPPASTPAPAPAPVRDTRVATYELQEKCAKDASAWYKHWWEDGPAIAGLTSNYTNHYNAKLGQCFLIVSSAIYGKKGTTESKTLIDVLENRDLAAFDKWSGKDTPMRCEVAGVSCTSASEWDALTKPYLEE
jgi:hypothetical protein